MYAPTKSVLIQAIESLSQSRQRRLGVCIGERGWALTCAKWASACYAAEKVVWVTDQMGRDGLKASEVKQLLGQEKQLVVFDAWAGFNADSFGVLSGILVAGGLLLLLIPQNWSLYPDPDYLRINSWPNLTPRKSFFIERFFRLIEKDQTVWKISQNNFYLPEAPVSSTTLVKKLLDWGCVTADQSEAVRAILNLVDKAPNSLVISAERGRGKSSALGLAAAQLLKAGKTKLIRVISARKKAVQASFQHASEQLTEATNTFSSISWQGAAIEFTAPDRFLQESLEPCLVMVDEAAALPIPVLQKILQKQLKDHQSSVFSTTVQGYEGSGQGFTLRFSQVLNRLTPLWKSVNLTHPIRWQQLDALECFTNEALLLQAQPLGSIPQAKLKQATIEVIGAKKLVDNEALLKPVFGLLMLAHYRTTPTDLRQLLDGQEVSVVVMHYHYQVLAVSLLSQEGGMDVSLARQVWLGYKRPKGHLLAQSLAVHAGFERLPQTTGFRIVRIAVHPQLQGQGLGSGLIEFIKTYGVEKNQNWIGCSFGLTLKLLRFWQKNRFQPVRLSCTRQASSGCHSLLAMYPISRDFESIFDIARIRFFYQLPYYFSQPFIKLEKSTEQMLLSYAADIEGQKAKLMIHYNWLDLLSYCWGSRTFEVVLPAIYWFYQNHQSLCDEQTTLYAIKLIEKNGWPETAKRCQLGGQKQARKKFKDLLKVMISPFVDKKYKTLLSDLQELSSKKIKE